jgi:hypothetical protein
VALGFNPTDVFRPRTLVGQASLDPSVLSRNRLGTLMLRAQAIGERGAVSIVYAPKLFAPSAITADPIGVDPRFEATNAAHRVLVSAGGNAGDVSVQGIAYFEPRRSKVGLALTRPVGASVVAQVPTEDRTSREQSIQRGQLKSGEAYRDLQQAQYESKLAEQDFLNAQDAQKAAQKQADESKRQLDAHRLGGRARAVRNALPAARTAHADDFALRLFFDRRLGHHDHGPRIGLMLRAQADGPNAKYQQ